jgi:Cu2+-exporting ATPase
VAQDLGIDTVFVEALPEQKTSRIQDVQGRGKRVAMVGDGVNDAPALVTAAVGIAIGAGTNVAVEAGDVVLVCSDPGDVPRIVNQPGDLPQDDPKPSVGRGIRHSRHSARAGVIAPWGVVLHPAVGAVLMSLSTHVVAINAQLLRGTRL